MALALLSCLQHLPLSFAVTSLNFSAEGGVLRELLLITTSAFHPTLQARGCVGIAFHTSQTAGAGLCWASVPVLLAVMVWFEVIAPCALSHFIQYEQHPSWAMFWDGDAGRAPWRAAQFAQLSDLIPTLL